MIQYEQEHCDHCGAVKKTFVRLSCDDCHTPSGTLITTSPQQGDWEDCASRLRADAAGRNWTIPDPTGRTPYGADLCPTCRVWRCLRGRALN